MNICRAKLACGLWLLVFSASAAGVQQPETEAGLSAEANSAYDAKEWAKAARSYQGLVKEHPEVPRLWIRLAESQQQLGRLDQALLTMQDGLKASVPPLFGEYIIASIY